MIDGATVVWLAEAPSQQGASSDEARRALEAWSRARGVELAPPAEGGAPPVAIDWGAGDAVEHALARVRDALSGLDFDAAERELARAEVVLRDHPELPQAAALRAEVERAWSARWLRGGDASDEERARRAWQRAAGLDGGREPGLGEKAYAADTPIAAAIHLDGDGGSLRLDGASIAGGEVKRSEGEHALAIVGADGAAIWAAWVSLAAGAVVRVRVPEAPPCSSADVSRASLEGGAVRANGVRCPRWVAAIPAPGGAVRVATCEKGSCGSLVEWRSIASVASGWTFGPMEPAREPRFRWPAWATWTLAGVGVAGAAVGIVAAAGAFRSQPAQTEFVNGGIQVHSF